jgi:cyclophilin family peptidyl-prolyl cis-trans isomerase
MKLLLAALAMLATARAQAVRFETTEGDFVVEVHRDWAPHGADRFLELVRDHYYDDSRFFRVVAGKWAQFGIAGDPAVAQKWRHQTIPDDPVKQSNLRGYVGFAFTTPGTRSTQVFISLADNTNLDAQGFAPFGKVTQGMDVVDRLYSGYGENSGGGMRAGKQDKLFEEGNAYLDSNFPQLDAIIDAVLAPQAKLGTRNLPRVPTRPAN